jgi:GNAT superfamily N-acetyltransferase
MISRLVNEMPWDSSFFGKKIGELHINHASPDTIGESVEQAKNDGFRYLLCKVALPDTSIIMALETNGFYLADIAVTWHINMLNRRGQETTPRESAADIRLSTERDIPMAGAMAKSMFIDSRFYNDPFFTKEEADKLYQAWIENSIRGINAHAVFLMPDAGFIALKKTGEITGEIALIGVIQKMQGQQIGRKLVNKAFNWFKSEGISNIFVKTQLRNIRAMNFYAGLGFKIKGYSITFGNIL